MHKTLLSISLSVVAAASLLSSAFIAPKIVTAYYPTTGYYSQCTNIQSDLYSGSSDALTGGQVSILQNFLISKGYISSVRAATGFFGSVTTRAIKNYQANNGILASGYVDYQTRNVINSESCGSSYSSTDSNGYFFGGVTGGYNYNYNNYYPYNNYVAYAVPTISSLSTYSGASGVSVTVYGTGFDSLNNTVSFNGITQYGIPSYNGTALAFVVPQVNNNYNNSYNYNYNYNSVYPITVTTTRGTSNAMNFTLNSNYNNSGYCNGVYYNGGYNNTYNGNCYNNYNNGTMSVSNISGPTTLTTGNSGIWSLSLNNPSNNYVTVNVRWGDEGIYNVYGYNAQQSSQSSYAQGQQTLTFTHTYSTNGFYTVVFTATNSQGLQTSVSTTVSVTGSGNIYNTQPVLSSISPSSGRVGTQVILYGSGFTPTGNTVHFGNGGMANVSASTGGTSIYYTIPSYISGCDLPGSYTTICPMYAQSIVPGTYPVYVSNTNGQTTTMYFTVTY